MSKTQEINRRESNKKVAEDISELSAITGLDPSRIKLLLHSFTMSEIRAGSMVWWRWVPKESVIARYSPQPNHVAAMADYA